MLIIISPAKTLDLDAPPITQLHSQPRFLSDSRQLIKIVKKFSPADISSLMKISEKLAILNFERFHDWQIPFTPDNAKQALLAFKGDVYTGLAAETLDENGLVWANEHLAILSGLYGLLRPLDLMQAYRLEMGTKLDNPRGKNLYAFWGSQITEAINEQLAKEKRPVLLNLASNEYYKVLQPKSIAANIITPVFKDEKNGQYKIISFYAKKARGLMARWIIDHRITDHKLLVEFNVAGYFYDADESDAKTLVFKRQEQI
ncbi:MAG: peroxide stress protein YaaA [Gammaproteobacteria bacterium]|nr:MAG: peroxide stress protein YaaA [Gammaproteobacteria bacterium]